MLLKIFLITTILFFPFVAQGASLDIDINTAPLEDLVKIIHIGEKRAKELISLRPFSSLDDLIRIKGIGEKRVEDIKKQGLAWVSSQGKPEPEPKSERKSEPKKETIPISYPTGVVFNEILPSPEGPDAENEWIVPTNEHFLCS